MKRDKLTKAVISVLLLAKVDVIASIDEFNVNVTVTASSLNPPLYDLTWRTYKCSSATYGYKFIFLHVEKWKRIQLSMN